MLLIGHEAALGPEAVDHRGGDPLGRGQEAVAQLGRQVRQGHHVLARHQQHVALEDRALVEEGDEVLGSSSTRSASSSPATIAQKTQSGTGQARVAGAQSRSTFSGTIWARMRRPASSRSRTSGTEIE